MLFLLFFIFCLVVWEGTLKIFAGHLYILDAVDIVNKTIDLRNPHGNNHIKNLSAIQLEDYFESYQEC